MNYQFYLLRDNSKTPHDVIIPIMKNKIKNWNQIYKYNLTLKNFRNVYRLLDQYEKERGK